MRERESIKNGKTNHKYDKSFISSREREREKKKTGRHVTGGGKRRECEERRFVTKRCYVWIDSWKRERERDLSEWQVLWSIRIQYQTSTSTRIQHQTLFSLFISSLFLSLSHAYNFISQCTFYLRPVNLTDWFYSLSLSLSLEYFLLLHLSPSQTNLSRWNH